MIPRQRHPSGRMSSEVRGVADALDGERELAQLTLLVQALGFRDGVHLDPWVAGRLADADAGPLKTGDHGRVHGAVGALMVGRFPGEQSAE